MHAIPENVAMVVHTGAGREGALPEPNPYAALRLSVKASRMRREKRVTSFRSIFIPEFHLPIMFWEFMSSRLLSAHA